MTAADRTFTYEEALEMFPLVRELTTTAIAQIEAIVNRVQSRDEMERRKDEIQSAIDSIVQAWSDELQSMGCETKGMWLVDWDSGAGYYCWKYPEETIGHFHEYEDGFAGRVPVN